MPDNEQQAFAKRLNDALVGAGLSVSQTHVWRSFNQVHPGPPVSVHAVRKWLVGEAIPTQDKIQTIATWLAVPVDWLRFGSPQNDSVVNDLSPLESSYIDDFRRLSGVEKERLVALVRVLAGRE